MSEWLGKKLGKYEIVALQGHGGMADVYKAFQPGPDRFVAIKILHRHLAAEPGFMTRFEREAAALARLRHPHIVQLYDFDLQDDVAYMVMEFIDGVSLDTRLRDLKKHGRWLSLEETVQILTPLAEAVDYAHSQGMIHRDLKPSNVMFTAGGQLVLADFGIARIAGLSRQTATSGLIGTPRYISPEQCRGEDYDWRSDIYSLGVMLYEMAVGCLPFDDENPLTLFSRHAYDQPPAPRQFHPEFTPHLEVVLLTPLQKDPARRYQSAGELTAAFRQAIQSDVVEYLAPMPGGSDTLRFDTPPHARPFNITSERIGQSDFIRNLEHALEMARRALAILEKQAAGYSSLTIPPNIQIALEDKRQEVAELDLQLRSAIQPSRPATRPFQAPARTSDLLGRETLLNDLQSALLETNGGRILALTGMGGVGKTTTAIHLAHSLRPKFADGVLWANAAASQPVAILGSWAHAFDWNFSALPDLESRAAALRGLLAEKNVLLIFDDVRNADDIRSLLPSGDHCAVLITTRNTEIAVTLNAHTCPLGPLTPEGSLALMMNLLGEQRVRAEQETAAEICELLGHLPLAVEIVSQRLSTHRRRKLADLAEHLRDAQARLAELKMSDRQVRASFEISWEALEPQLQEVFAHLGVFRGRPFDAPALAAVNQLPLRQVENCLYALTDLSLVSEDGNVLYRQHPLLADFALENLPDALNAEIRLARHFLAYAETHAAEALDWAWGYFSSGMEIVYREQLWDVVIGYARALTDVWFRSGHYDEARQGYAWACEAAEANDHLEVIAEYQYQWGRTYLEQTKYQEAEKHFNRSLELLSNFSRAALTASIQVCLAQMALQQDDFEKASRLLAESQTIREDENDQLGVAEIYYMQARVAFRQGNYDNAKYMANQAFEIQSSENNESGLALTLIVLATIALEQKQIDSAEILGQEAFSLGEKLHDKQKKALALDILSDVYRKQNRLDLAEIAAEDGILLYKSMGDMGSEGYFLYQLSKIYAKQGKLAQALETGYQCVRICEQTQSNLLQSYVLIHIGDLHQSLEQMGQARHNWENALAIAQKLDNPTAIKKATEKLIR